MKYKCLDVGGRTHLCKESTLNGYLVFKCDCGHEITLNIEWCFERSSDFCHKCQTPIPRFKMIQKIEEKKPTKHDFMPVGDFERYKNLNIIKGD